MAKKILIVDDDPDLRDATQIMLSGAGYDVFGASSGAEAMAMLDKQAVDLILLDVMMETDTEGFHLAYKIRENPRLKNVPILMITCIEEKTGEVLEPDKAGDFLPVQGFLRKPLDMVQLQSKIQAVLK